MYITSLENREGFQSGGVPPALKIEAIVSFLAVYGPCNTIVYNFIGYQHCCFVTIISL